MGIDHVYSVKHTVSFHDLPLEKQLFFNVLVHSRNHSISMSYRGVQTSLHFDRVYTSLDADLISDLTLSIAYTTLAASTICVVFQCFSQYKMHSSVMAQVTASYLKSLKSSDKEVSTKVSTYITEDTKESDSPRYPDTDQSPDGSNLIGENEYVFSEDDSSPHSPGSPRSPVSFEEYPPSGREDDMDRSPAKSDADLLEELLSVTSPD